MQTAPYIIIEETSDGKIRKIDGFVIEILKWMADRYNFTLVLNRNKYLIDIPIDLFKPFINRYEYVQPPDMAFGAFVNGSWNGLVGMVVRGVIIVN